MANIPQTQALTSKTFRPPPLSNPKFAFPDFCDWLHVNSSAHPFFVFEDAPGTLKKISGGEAVHAIHRAAFYVASRLPSALARAALDGRPTMVATLANSDTLTYMTLELGIMRSGLTVFPISPRNSPEAVAHLLRSTAIQYLFVGTEPAMQRLVVSTMQALDRSDGAREIAVFDMPKYGELYPEEERDFKEYPKVKYDLDAPALVLHSSGSTAFPKPITWSHSTLKTMCSIPWWGGFDFCDEVLSCHTIPVFHAMGILQMILAISAGATLAVFKPSSPATVPNAQNVLNAMMVTQCTVGLTAPAFLETWSRDSRALEYLKTTKVTMFGGGPLSSDAAARLTAAGVAVSTQYGCTEGGPISRTLPEHRTSEAWAYFSISPHVKATFIAQDDDTFELVILDDPTCHPAVLNTTIDGVRGYATSDLFKPHPSKSGMWAIYGRKDDQIMLSTGEKTNPAPLESIINQDPHVSAAIMFGRGRFQNGVLVDPKPQFKFDSEDENGLDHFRDLIWPSIEKANAFAPQHSRIFKEMIICSSSRKPFLYTAKMTARRQATIKEYANEIDAVYEAVSQGSQSPSSTQEPVPKEWNRDETRTFVRRTVQAVIKEAFTDDADLFQCGCDSLQATWIRNSFFRALSQAAPDAARYLPDTFVYEFPTIASMAAYLCRAVADPSLNPMVDLATRARELQTLVDSFTAEFPTRPYLNGHAIHHEEGAGDVYLVTGTTGSLGSNMLAQLLRSPTVRRVYAYNRPSSGGVGSRERHEEVFKNRYLDPSLLGTEKVVFLQGELTQNMFGLGEEQYIEMLGSISHIIHNAWPVNFNTSVKSFNSSLRGVRCLVDFALTSRLRRPPRLLFISSIGVLNNFDAGAGLVPEIAIENPEVPIGTGYAESKWASERILHAAAERTELKPVIVRLGQVCGDATNVWNETEWFPTIVKAAETLRCLPTLDGNVTWIPATTAASTLIDMSKSDELYLHLVHPRPVPFATIMTTIAEDLGVKLVTFSAWLEALEQAARRAGDNPELVRQNPALRLLSFFRAARVGDDWEPIGVAKLDIRKALSVSETLSMQGGSLGEEDTREWIRSWRKSGFLV
ncbi:acetyl-CoA synthetase-like protein [Amylostereum chailletii]|nr:acetyl-CoA synthetase-like protein [Amylostereum chailletii]